MELAGIPGSEQLTTTHGETQRHTQEVERHTGRMHVLFGINQRVSFLFPLFSFPASHTCNAFPSKNEGSNKKYVVRKNELNGAGIQKGKCRPLSDDVVRQIGLY